MLRSAQIAPRLSDQLLNSELGDRFDRLPLLQRALMRAWDRWRKSWRDRPCRPRKLCRRHGGVERALSNDADQRRRRARRGGRGAECSSGWADTDPNLRRVRSPHEVSELAAVAGTDARDSREIVRRFSRSDGRSFVYASADGDPADLRVDISHESLIRRWDRLGIWADEEQRDRDEFVELVHRARRFARGEAAPLQGPEPLALAEWKRPRQSVSTAWAARYWQRPTIFRCHGLCRGAKRACQKRSRWRMRSTRRRWAQAWAPPLLALFAMLSPWRGEISLHSQEESMINFKNNSLSDPWKIWDDTLSSYQVPEFDKGTVFPGHLLRPLHLRKAILYSPCVTSRVETRSRLARLADRASGRGEGPARPVEDGITWIAVPPDARQRPSTLILAPRRRPSSAVSRWGSFPETSRRWVGRPCPVHLVPDSSPPGPGSIRSAARLFPGTSPDAGHARCRGLPYRSLRESG